MKTNFNQVINILKNIDINSNINKTIFISFLENNISKNVSFEIREDFTELIRKTILFYNDESITFLKILIDDKMIFSLKN